MHMISKKNLSDAEMDTLTKLCSPTIVITANGEVQTHEEATVYVKELGIFCVSVLCAFVLCVLVCFCVCVFFCVFLCFVCFCFFVFLCV